ncbi:phosphotransferase [Arthrobacter sp. 260]|uniref:phosphotransferase family protein n=1 Tax=Arthrobacter sp. 260 TaxID=2735314 RepID=UPI001490DE41|nr:phosphotransferase [Arthrobacter sp. 260]NOJ60379.1 phosphotransferase [Arthrobacter sp. 260]
MRATAVRSQAAHPALAVDPALPGLAEFFDSDRLSELLGHPVWADRLRHKPGTSAVARLREAGGGIGWLATYSPDAAAKLEKTFSRAVGSGLEVHHVALPDYPEHSLVSGPIELDHRLYRPLRPFREAGFGWIFADRAVEVLNYNPQRRVVFGLRHRGERLVCKLGAAPPHADGQLLAKLASSGVPVLETVDRSGLPTSSHVQYFSWFGSGDLSTVGASHPYPLEAASPGTAADAGAASYAAGMALALLHQQPPAFESHRWRAPAGSLIDLVRETSSLLPGISDRLERLRAGLEPLLRRPGRAALIHGDFSADQVLVDGSDIRLTDLERCTYGAGASDLGSFAAVEILHSMPLARGTDVLALPRTAAMLDGYSAGPTGATETEVLGWTVFHLLNRLSEPFRSCSPTWRQDMVNQLDLMEDILW